MNSDYDLLRKGLWPLSMVYGLCVVVRNYLFDIGARKIHKVSVPVVSVGNLAAGGTGKTPLVVWLVQKARAAGRSPGVLARGYGRAPGDDLNDEGKLLARRFSDLPQVQDPDRVRGAQKLISDAGVDLILLDDGFQHRRLHRDVDLVCLDFARPFAGGVIPVGYLREVPKALRRASAVVYTRAGGYSQEARDERTASMRSYFDVPSFFSTHAPSRLVSMPVGCELGLDGLQEQRVLLLSGIARADTFADTVRGLGAEIVDHVRRRDHHLHTASELADVGRRAESLGAVVVTTEKDDVKLGGMATRRIVVELDLEFLGEEPAVGLLFPDSTRS